MAEKIEKKPQSVKLVKKALVLLEPNRERVYEDDEEENDEIENWPEDGKDNILPIGREVVVSLHLADRLVAGGRIKNYRIVTLKVS